MKTKFTLIILLIISFKTFCQNRFEPRYMFMNGFDFQLENIDKLKYVGHFNIYIPITNNKNGV